MMEKHPQFLNFVSRISTQTLFHPVDKIIYILSYRAHKQIIAKFIETKEHTWYIRTNNLVLKYSMEFVQKLI